MSQDKDRSPFVKAAIALDAEFERFERLKGELDRLNLDSDRGYERGLAIMEELEACRERFGPASQELARAMEEARERTALAAQSIGQHEELLKARRERVEALLERYKQLGELVQRVTSAAAALKTPSLCEITPEDRAQLGARLPELDQQLDVLVEQSRILMDEARGAHLKVLERNADSLRQSLQSARHRFKQLAERTAPQTH
jgi:hypothetical protein